MPQDDDKKSDPPIYRADATVWKFLIAFVVGFIIFRVTDGWPVFRVENFLFLCLVGFGAYKVLASFADAYEEKVERDSWQYWTVIKNDKLATSESAAKGEKNSTRCAEGEKNKSA